MKTQFSGVVEVRNGEDQRCKNSRKGCGGVQRTVGAIRGCDGERSFVSDCLFLTLIHLPHSLLFEKSGAADVGSIPQETLKLLSPASPLLLGSKKSLK